MLQFGVVLSVYNKWSPSTTSTAVFVSDLIMRDSFNSHVQRPSIDQVHPTTHSPIQSFNPFL